MKVVASILRTVDVLDASGRVIAKQQAYAPATFDASLPEPNDYVANNRGREFYSVRVTDPDTAMRFAGVLFTDDYTTPRVELRATEVTFRLVQYRHPGCGCRWFEWEFAG